MAASSERIKRWLQDRGIPVTASSERIKRWLQDRGILPDNSTIALAALAISLEDWKRELERSIRRQRRSVTQGEDEWPS